jgi:type II secretion system protein N
VRLRRIVARVAIATAVFVLVFVVALALNFPTDAIVHAAIARLMPAGGRRLVFERARLQPSGLRLDGVDVLEPGGRVVAHADWLILRPSLAGLVGDGHTGRPWHVRAGTCAGTIEALADRDATGDVVNVEWSDIDLARCPALAVVVNDMKGIAAGHARLTGAGVAGDAELRAVTWPGLLPGIPALRADSASSRWTFAGSRLGLDGLVLRGPDLEARGGGTVHLAGRPGDSILDLRLTLAPGPDAPVPLRNAILQLPGGGGRPDERRVVVTGPAIAPQVVAAP